MSSAVLPRTAQMVQAALLTVAVVAIAGFTCSTVAVIATAPAFAGNHTVASAPWTLT